MLSPPSSLSLKSEPLSPLSSVSSSSYADPVQPPSPSNSDSSSTSSSGALDSKDLTQQIVQGLQQRGHIVTASPLPNPAHYVPAAPKVQVITGVGTRPAGFVQKGVSPAGKIVPVQEVPTLKLPIPKVTKPGEITIGSSSFSMLNPYILCSCSSRGGHQPATSAAAALGHHSLPACSAPAERSAQSGDECLRGAVGGRRRRQRCNADIVCRGQHCRPAGAAGGLRGHHSHNHQRCWQAHHNQDGAHSAAASSLQSVRHRQTNCARRCCPRAE